MNNRKYSVQQQFEKISLEFWQRSKLPTNFPLDIGRAISRTQPILITSICALSLKKVEEYLISNEITYRNNHQNRNLHGFLFVQNGLGHIFINGSDPPDEQRFTLAHELAHFFLDYLQPRDKIVERMGNQIIEVLDGYREPTIEERLSGIISNLNIFQVSHLLDSAYISGFEQIKVWNSENRADQLALELLAPKTLVRKDYIGYLSSTSLQTGLDYLFKALTTKFGLPHSIAKSYSIYLYRNFSGRKSLQDEWGIEI
jgi:Zn-dependent peptidase ImmA (M78 family)